MNYYFYLTLFTMGRLWEINVLYFSGFLCCVVWGIYYLKISNNSTNNWQPREKLLLICWLATGPLRLVGLVGWLMCLLLAGTEAC